MQNMKKRRLKLSKHTLRRLSAGEQEQAVAGRTGLPCTNSLTDVYVCCCDSVLWCATNQACPSVTPALC